MKFTQVKRMGPPKPGKVRPIVASFHFFGDVWKGRGKIRHLKFWMAEDFAPEMQEKRQILKPILKHAIDNNLSEKAYLVFDKLIIDGATYSVENLIQPPDELDPVKVVNSTIGDKVAAFHNRYSPFSNFYEAKFTLEGQEYQHVEQYFWKKKKLIMPRTKNYKRKY